MIVTQQALQQYLGTFHDALKTAAAELPPELREDIRPLALAPSRVTCYFSTELGVAFSYARSNRPSFKFVSGAARVEDLVFRPPESVQRLAPAFVMAAGVENVGVRGLEFRDIYPVRFVGSPSSIFLDRILIQTRNVKPKWRLEIEYVELYAERSADYWDHSRALTRARERVELVKHYAAQGGSPIVLRPDQAPAGPPSEPAGP